MIKEKKSKLQANEDKFAYLFIAPFVIGFIFLYADLISQLRAAAFGAGGVKFTGYPQRQHHAGTG